MEIQFRSSLELILRLYEEQIINMEEKIYLKDYLMNQINVENLANKQTIESLLLIRLKIFRNKFSLKQSSSESLHSINEEADNFEED